MNKTVHKNMLPLDLQLFAEKEEQSPKEDVHTEGEGGDNTQQQEESTKTLDELLSTNKALQSEFDKKITQALATAKAKWEEKAKED